MATPFDVVTLFDCDNTLLDHDQVVADPGIISNMSLTESIQGSLEVIEHFGKLGPTVILSDGDVVFQGKRSTVKCLSTFIKRVCWMTSNGVIRPGTT